MESNGLDAVIDITDITAEEAEAEARKDAEKAYLTRLSAFNKGYRQLVAAVFVGVLA